VYSWWWWRVGPSCSWLSLLYETSARRPRTWAGWGAQGMIVTDAQRASAHTAELPQTAPALHFGYSTRRMKNHAAATAGPCTVRRLVGSERKAAASAQSGRQKGEAPGLPLHPRSRTVVYQRRAQRKTAAKSSAHAHTVPPRPPTTAAAAKKRADSHVLPPVMQRGRHRRWRPQQSTRARRLLSRAATAAAGDDCGGTHTCGCTRLLSRRRTGHSPKAVAPGAGTTPTDGQQIESAPSSSVSSRRCAAPPLCHCEDDRKGARKASPRPFSTVSQVARPRRTP